MHPRGWQPGPEHVGRDVTLRLRTPVGPITVVGELLAADPQRLVLRRRDGRVVEAAPADVEAARLVPDPPSRAVSPAELERIAAAGVPATDTEALGQWWLRATPEVPGSVRANAACAAGDPGMPLPEAVAAVSGWYAARSLPPRIAVVASDPVEAALREQGWTRLFTLQVMTAEIAHVLRRYRAEASGPEAAVGGAASGEARPGGPEAVVDVAERPGPDWIGVQEGPAAADRAAIAARHPGAAFVTIRDRDRPVAAARISVDGRWAGVFAVAVDPAVRRRGWGRAVTVTALEEAVRRGARHAYLQVSEDNAAAAATYRRLGFRPHHATCYLAAAR